MKPTAYVQKKDGEFANINFLTAYIGLKKFHGHNIKFFEQAEEILDYVTKETIVYGGIPVMNKVFERLGVKPVVEYYPTELYNYLGRSVELVPVSKVRDHIDSGHQNPPPLFVKPSIDLKKSFTGRVCKKFIDLLHFQHLAEDDSVWISDPVEFVSEYRCFVHKVHGVLGVKHYAGDWQKMIDVTKPDECRKAFTQSPIAYSLDLGLTSDGRTLLVECNDALSLGCYGLDPSAFSLMIVDRWREIMA